jgi:hypothetical protein
VSGQKALQVALVMLEKELPVPRYMLVLNAQ